MPSSKRSTSAAVSAPRSSHPAFHPWPTAARRASRVGPLPFPEPAAFARQAAPPTDARPSLPSRAAASACDHLPARCRGCRAGLAAARSLATPPTLRNRSGPKPAGARAADGPRRRHPQFEGAAGVSACWPPMPQLPARGVKNPWQVPQDVATLRLPSAGPSRAQSKVSTSSTVASPSRSAAWPGTSLRPATVPRASFGPPIACRRPRAWGSVVRGTAGNLAMHSA